MCVSLASLAVRVPLNTLVPLAPLVSFILIDHSIDLLSCALSHLAVCTNPCQNNGTCAGKRNKMRAMAG